jgi:hypothetical protein
MLLCGVHAVLQSEGRDSFQRPREGPVLRASGSSPVPGSKTIPYDEAFRAGVRQYEQRRYGDAALSFAYARASEPTGRRVSRQVRLYGQRWEEYLPAFYEARARIRIGGCDQKTMDSLVVRLSDEVGPAILASLMAEIRQCVARSSPRATGFTNLDQTTGS